MKYMDIRDFRVFDGYKIFVSFPEKITEIMLSCQSVWCNGAFKRMSNFDSGQ
jgi:hypothetical protein